MSKYLIYSKSRLFWTKMTNYQGNGSEEMDLRSDPLQNGRLKEKDVITSRD